MRPARFPSLGLRDPAFLGAGGGITPANLPGVVRWWVASDLDAAYNDGDLITTNWVDRIIGDNAVPFAGAEPTFRTNLVPSGAVSFINGLKHFVFTELTQVALSILFVDRSAAAGAAGDYIIMSSKAGNYQVRWRGTVTPTNTFEMLPNSGSLLDSTATAGDLRTLRMSGVTRTAGGVPKFYRNLVELSESGSQTNTNNMRMQTLGLYNSAGFTSFQMAECVIGNQVWDLATITQVYNEYFQPTYGL